MGKLTDEQLDEIFRNGLHGHEKDIPGNPWASLKKNVKKNNFLSRGWKHFNVYYLAFSVTLLSFCFFIIFENTISEETHKRKEKFILPSDTISSIHKPSTEVPIERSTPSNKKTITKTTQQTNRASSTDRNKTEVNTTVRPEYPTIVDSSAFRNSLDNVIPETGLKKLLPLLNATRL